MYIHRDQYKKKYKFDAESARTALLSFLQRALSSLQLGYPS